jgi:hypothetical protein
VVIEVARLLLAALFAVAAVAKLADLDGARRAAREFGVRARLVPAVALLVPITESAIAFGLLFSASARLAAVVAAMLLTGFAIAVGTALRRGMTPDCGCFGRLHSAAGWPVVGRNLGLVAVAALVASKPATSIGLSAVAVVVVGAYIVGQAVLWFVLLRRYGDALRRLDALAGEHGNDDGLLDGAAVPSFELRTVTGDRTFRLSDLLDSHRPLLLVFTDERCGACSALYPKIAGWQEDLDRVVEVAVLGDGNPERLRALAGEHDIENLLVADRATFVALGVEATPCALLVAPDGRVARPMSYGSLDIEALVLDSVEASIAEAARVA